MSLRRCTFAVIVNDTAGVMSRVAGLFSRRGFNIASIAVGASEAPGLSRMTIVADADDDTAEQITKQLNKLIDVIKVSEIADDEAVARELALIRVSATAAQRAEISQVAGIFRARIVDVTERSVMIETTGDAEKVEALIDLLRSYGIQELARTGRIAMVRGGHAQSQAQSQADFNSVAS